MSKKIEDVLQTLKEGEGPLATSTIRVLSDLADTDQKAFYAFWPTIPLDRRRQLVRNLGELAEHDFETDFGAVTRLAMTDLDAQLREDSIRISQQDDSPDMMNRLMSLASIDQSPKVRARAISALGRFILLGELGKMSRLLYTRQAENLAIRLYQKQDEDIEVRRRALEAVANSSRDEVTPMIEDAYNSDNIYLRASAVTAMGRTCNEIWASRVLREMRSEDAELRLAAARSAGELELDDAIPTLAEMLDEDNRALTEVIVWSLGEIGGREASSILEEISEQAEERNDDEMLDLIEEALASANLAGSGFVIE